MLGMLSIAVGGRHIEIAWVFSGDMDVELAQYIGAPAPKPFAEVAPAGTAVMGLSNGKREVNRRLAVLRRGMNAEKVIARI
ncbi:MAG: hypothetical protein KGJ78_18745 [Alphaproteobacteria bacterium]|nr:hypothetical protein [Alphaproteobacteria bacterium]